MSEKVVSSLRAIEPTVARYLGARVGMAELLDGSAEQLGGVVRGFDKLIETYNSLGTQHISKDFSHLHQAKQDVATLPTISNWLTTKSGLLYRRPFIRSLQDMGCLMERAEAGRDEPALAFPTWSEAPQADKLLGGVSHAYGLTLSHGRFDNDGQQMLSSGILYEWETGILDALLEVSVIEHGSGNDTQLFTLAQKQGWFDVQNALGTYLFSGHVRSLAAA